MGGSIRAAANRAHRCVAPHAIRANHGHTAARPSCSRAPQGPSASHAQVPPNSTGSRPRRGEPAGIGTVRQSVAVNPIPSALRRGSVGAESSIVPQGRRTAGATGVQALIAKVPETTIIADNSRASVRIDTYSRRDELPASPLVSALNRRREFASRRSPVRSQLAPSPRTCRGFREGARDVVEPPSRTGSVRATIRA